MRVFAIDLETTGLNPNVHAIVEMAVFSFDLMDEKAPTHLFHRYIYPDNLVWTAYCLNLHKELLPKLLLEQIPRDSRCEVFTDFGIPKSVPAYKLFRELETWHKELGYKDEKGKLASMICAGKNFGSFDLQFIKMLPDFKNIFKHRSLDPAQAYLLQNDTVPPELAECKRRASLMGATFNRLEVTHTAVDDVMDVVELLKHSYNNRQWIPKL